MRLIDTHRLLLVGGLLVMMAKKTFGRAGRLSDIPGRRKAEGAIASRHTTSACAIVQITRGSLGGSSPLFSNFLILFKGEVGDFGCVVGGRWLTGLKSCQAFHIQPRQNLFRWFQCNDATTQFHISFTSCQDWDIGPQDQYDASSSLEFIYAFQGRSTEALRMSRRHREPLLFIPTPFHAIPQSSPT